MFESILGQKKIKKIISNQVKSGKIAHAYIFVGQDGVGKRLTAVEFAKILNCNVDDFIKTDAGTCGKCISCKKIEKNIHPDLHFIDFARQAELEEECLEKQRTLKIETIRYMQKEVATKIHEGKWKIFIIEPAERMNAAAANSLLKTLEEPPENTIIILIAKHKETIPQTILSRVQTLFFQPLGQNEISSWLMLNCSVDAAKARDIAELSEGSLENANKLVGKNEKEEFSLWLKFKTRNFYISDILELSKNIAAAGALECVDAMIAEAKKDFRMYPQRTAPALDLLSASRVLLLKNVNAMTVLDNLFFDLSDLKKMSGLL
ncbi:DNA polymerase III subunit delta' [Candidatus Endomicrobiellum trichonymphae]|uniref:DNA polymerase III subunit delta' n=1 Tax=Endomicrobium trichonymphae TaxID=1408204 RepID=UPI0008659641|nr:DNA polymerase III subunit delta' [Candidatus Endomicrobium trichonymphae]BAV58901.1 DNA polymerase III subunit delta' [Candidatus Endomicrobium trichonymphae]